MGPVVWLAAGALGAIGAVARVCLDAAVARRAVGDLPWGTLGVNVLGCLVLGGLAGADVTGRPGFLLAGGLVGSFTTFSTWMLETHRLAEEGRGRGALVNLGLSVALGLVAVVAGWWLGSLR